MIPWEKLEEAKAPPQGLMALFRRGTEYVIRVNGADLMGSRMHDSEEELARRGCAHVVNKTDARVLVGGLGMGYTLRAALDLLQPTGRVDVAELVPAIVEWNKKWLGDLARRPMEDPRCHIIEGDVREIMNQSPGTYDAILLDVDNGPGALTTESNAKLYSLKGLARIAHALRPKGMLALWSASDDSRFTELLKKSALEGRAVKVPARKGGGKQHFLWLATKR